MDSQLSVQSMPITTKVVSSNSAHGEVYSIQLYYYMIKFVSDLRQAHVHTCIGGFLWVFRFSPPIKLK